jgi:hypothetical protein
MGPLTVFRERLLSADENFLAARNYTDCETIETSKEAAFDYRKQVQINEDIFKECRIITDAYVSADVTSTHLQDGWITSN